MLTKILVTALVILGCYAFIRFQRNKQPAQSKQAVLTGRQQAKISVASSFKWLAVSLVVLTLATAVGFFIYDWQDNHERVIVKVTNPHNGETVSYQVYKGDLQERSFETVQGQIIRVGNSERIEVSNPE